MAFSKIPQKKINARLTNPPPGLFDADQRRYLEAFVRDTSRELESVYREARKPSTTDQNPQREVISLDGKSGSVRVDLKQSQHSSGVPVFVYASSLNGNVSLAGFDNAYNWTIVHVINRDATNNIIVEQNAEISIAATVSLGKNGTIQLTQVEYAPVWIQCGAYVSSA